MAKKLKKNKTFNMFNGMSIANQISAKKLIQEFSDSIENDDMKNGFDEAIDSFYKGEDIVKETVEVITDNKEQIKFVRKFDNVINKIEKDSKTLLDISKALTTESNVGAMVLRISNVKEILSEAENTLILLKSEIDFCEYTDNVTDKTTEVDSLD